MELHPNINRVRKSSAFFMSNTRALRRSSYRSSRSSSRSIIIICSVICAVGNLGTFPSLCSISASSTICAYACSRSYVLRSYSVSSICSSHASYVYCFIGSLRAPSSEIISIYTYRRSIVKEYIV